MTVRFRLCCVTGDRFCARAVISPRRVVPVTVFARGGDVCYCCDDWRGGRVEMQPSRKR